MKTILPWLLVIGLSGASGAMFFSGRTKDAELVKLREQSLQAEAVQTQLEEAKGQAKALSDEIAGLQAGKQELLRLRNEIGQLRNEKLQMTKQIQTVQAQAERAQAQASQVEQLAAQQKQQFQAANEQLRSSATVQLVQQRTACMNSLHLLDRAKQQWALEQTKSADAVPTPQDIAPYLKDLPPCPAGGSYQINAINQPPTCSIPGHAISR